MLVEQPSWRPRRSPGRRRSQGRSGRRPSAPPSPRRSSRSCRRRHPPGRTAPASAEQRWPALWNAEEMTSRVTCSGSAELSTIIAFWPPVSAMNGMIGPSRSASVRLIMRAVSVEPVKTTPASSGCAVSVPPTTLPAPGASWTTSLGMPAWCISSTASAPISGVCPAGLAMTALPAASGADDQAGEDRQREIPRRNAGEHAAAVQAQLVLLAGRARQRQRPGELAPRFGRVEAQEIDRLAHFEHRVDQGLPGLADAEREEFFRDAPRRGRRRGRAAARALRRRARPSRCCAACAGADHPVDLGGARFEHRADRRSGGRGAR